MTLSLSLSSSSDMMVIISNESIFSFTFCKSFNKKLPSYELRSSLYCLLNSSNNICLTWDQTIEWCELLDLKPVKVIYRGIFDINIIKNLENKIDLDKDEELHEFILIRGWGNLTGAGSYNLDGEYAGKIQDTLAEYIVQKLNKQT